MKKIIIGLLSILLFIGVYLWGYIHSASQHIPPHFHANFAVFVWWIKQDFSPDKYMEDIAGCSITGKIWAKDRVHLHENNGDTIHVHHDGVTWGHFFSNNNIVFGEDFLRLDSWEMLVRRWDHGVIYILNGKRVENPFNTLINSEDKLLISFGDHNGEYSEEELYSQVSSNAGEYNSKYDPGSCGWSNENGIKVILRELINSFKHWHH